MFVLLTSDMCENNKSGSVLFLAITRTEHYLAAMNHVEPRIKLAIMGNGAVGKTSLCTALNGGRRLNPVYEMTVGFAITTSRITVDPKTSVKLVVWDMAGQSRFKSVREAGLYRGTRVAIIVFDLQNRGSFYDASSWIRELKRNASDPNIPWILVGNKNDKNLREVSIEEARSVAKKFNVPYIETSALTGHNVNEVFRLAAHMALKGSVVAF